MEHYVDCLICPICESDLARVGSSLKCERSHTFDVAREGYVNLLVDSRKSARGLGDTREMLVARRTFLERQHYEPLSRAINRRVSDYLLGGPVHFRPEDLPACILDAGCGDGYYLGQLKNHLKEQRPDTPFAYLGVDVSKDAARLAAKRYRQICFVVASITRKLPLATGSIRALLDVFAPRNPTEFARVLAADGLLLVVIPNPGHLRELRDALKLLEIEEDKEQRVAETFAQSFSLVDTEPIEYDLDLSSEDVANLVMMTPNYWHMSEQDREAVRALGEFRTRASFTILTFQKG